MKHAAKNWLNYLFAFFGILIIVTPAIIVYKVIGEPEWPLRYTFFFMIFGGIVFAGLGFIIQDLYRGWKRHKLNDWDNPLPDEIVNKAWDIFFPLLTSGFLTFLAGLIAFLITK